MKYILIFSFMILTLIFWGQDKKYNKGLGVEIGGGYNTLTHVLDYDENLTQLTDLIYRRYSLWLQPCVRLNYSYSLWKRNDKFKIVMMHFIGYYSFGGLSKTDPNGYKDILIF